MLRWPFALFLLVPSYSVVGSPHTWRRARSRVEKFAGNNNAPVARREDIGPMRDQHCLMVSHYAKRLAKGACHFFSDPPEVSRGYVHGGLSRLSVRRHFFINFFFSIRIDTRTGPRAKSGNGDAPFETVGLSFFAPSTAIRKTRRISKSQECSLPVELICRHAVSANICGVTFFLLLFFVS